MVRIYINFVIFLISLMIAQVDISIAQISEWEEQLNKDPRNAESLLNLGRHYHHIGGKEESEEAVKEAEKYLVELLEIEPKNYLAMVYYGSVMTMKARDTLFPWNKYKHIRKGFSRMDKAVYLDPDNPEIRLIRGANSTSMPRRLDRLSIALEDFKHIEKLNNKNPLKMTNKFWSPYYYNYGLALQMNNEIEAAKVKYIKVIEADPESEYAKYARRDLKKIEETEHDK